jgi:hypothetical protein
MQSLRSKLTRHSALAVLIVGLVTGVASAVAGHNVPWHGTAVGAIVVFNPTPQGVEVTVVASGNANQLGHYDRVENLLLNPDTGQFTGSIVFVAANHDELHVAVAGGFTLEGPAVGTYTIDGAASTGRFLGASGGADFVALNPPGGPVSVTFDGSISTVGN